MGLLPPPDAAEVAAHLRTCPACRHEAEQLRSFWAETGDTETSLWAELKEVVLQWVTPTAPMGGPALAGIRGAAAARAQTFTAAHLWLAVTVQESQSGKKNLLALVTREDGYPLEHGTAWLSQENRLLSGGRVDPNGNLVIADLDPGMYDLGIQCDGTRVWVRGVSV
jgi:anti-sigma factor RsiW